MVEQNKDTSKAQLGYQISNAATYRSMGEGSSQGQKWLKHNYVTKISFQHDEQLMSSQSCSMLHNLHVLKGWENAISRFLSLSEPLPCSLAQVHFF